MNLNYHETKEYWDKTFEEYKVYDPLRKLPYEKIEKAIEWLCEGAKAILDFGCGSGRAVSRCFGYNVEKIYGIDLSEKAIDLAQLVMDKYGLKDKSTFLCGGLSLLPKIHDYQFNGAILFNIIDNLKPEDGKLLIKEISRILKTNGRVILKLNPYLSRQALEDRGDLQELANNFYQESSGLFLWNISYDILKEIVSPYFSISGYEEIEFAEYNITDRLFYLTKI